MKLERMTEILEESDGCCDFDGACHDCKKGVIVSIIAKEDGVHVDGGAVYEPFPDSFMVKCDDCYKLDPVLRNYQEATVYARCVGYLTPTDQWNEGKKAEFRDRVMFKPWRKSA